MRMLPLVMATTALLFAAFAYRACRGPDAEALSRDAEQRDATGPATPEDGPRLASCDAARAMNALRSTDPRQRAAGALCAATLPCNHPEIDALLSPLTTDEAPGWTVVYPGAWFAGTETKSTPVKTYAQRAVWLRQRACP